MSDLAALAAQIKALSPKGRRLLVALAGPPASGKSTLAEELANQLGAGAMAVPMDGFHLDDAVLEDRRILNRKGSPPSFDADGFLNAMGRLASEEEVVLPVFDRSREISIAGRLVIRPDCQIAVVEGNYLLLDQDPWRDLTRLWDFTIYLDIPEDELRARLAARWEKHGKPDPEAWIEENDMPNTRTVITQRRPADVTLTG